MDGNKDEALKCVRIGKKALDAGDRVRAFKFLSKARRLDPSLALDDDLVSATAGDAEARDSPSPSPVPDSSSSPASAKAKAPSVAASYTEEQITIVRQIRKQKDYYQIMGLERTCSVEDVRKAYRKLSLKVHPDKNTAPGAEEAFKAVSKAFQCLSNDESRKKYDVAGTEEPDYGRAAARHRHTYNGFYDGEVDADEIFRNFFGGMAPATASFGTFGFRAGPGFHHEVHASGGFNVRTLMQILPVIVLLLVNILPSLFPSSEPVYVLSQSYQYNYKIETPRGVPYYVKSANFEEEYPYESPGRTSLERNVESEYFGILRQNCHVERQRRQWGLSYEMPHCEMLKKYQSAAA